MLEARLDIMRIIGILRINEIRAAATIFAPGKAEREKNTPQAKTAPTGAENTALNTTASNDEASLTKPELFRTKTSGFPVEKLDIYPP
jgi:hypothetical protein